MNPKYKQFFSYNESINDKNIFKAVFIVGGPGSGKSFISNLMFGIKDRDDVGRVVGATLLGWSARLGAKVVNPDDITTIKLKSKGLTTNFVTDDDIIAATTEVERDELIDLQNKQQEERRTGKRIKTRRQNIFLDGMLPLIIDGTGKESIKIKQKAAILRVIGYDVSMVFINTTLETALQRNAKRERVVDPSLVEKFWYQVQNNLGQFQNYFGKKNFIIIDNSKAKEGKEMDEFKKQLFKLGNKLFSKPLENHIGKGLIDYMKAKGYKYLSDIPEYEIPFLK